MIINDFSFDTDFIMNLEINESGVFNMSQEISSIIEALNMEDEMNEFYECLLACNSPEEYFTERRSDGGDATSDRMKSQHNVGGRILGTGMKAARATGQTLHNTAQTTKNALDAYGNITDSGGKVIKSAWDLAMSVVRISTKLISIISEQVSKLGTTASHIIDKIGEIPDDIRKHLHGSIDLYITANDLDTFDEIRRKFPEFLQDLSILCKGDTFKTTRLFNGDITTYKRCEQYFKIFSKIEFVKSRIEISDMSVYDLYFSQNSDYIKSLTETVEWMNKQKPVLTEINRELQNKMARTENFGGLADMSSSHIEKFRNLMGMCGSAMGTMNKFVRYITEDLKTLSQSTDQIIKKIEKHRKKIDKEIEKQSKQ